MTYTQKTFLDNLLLAERECVKSVLIEEEYSDETERLELEQQMKDINGVFGALNELELTGV